MMQEKRPGILVINGCLPPPYGGIARYLSRMLPMLSAQGYRVWAAMPRAYSNQRYDEVRRAGVEILIPPGNRWPSLLALAGRYSPLLWERCVRYGLPCKEALFALNEWLPEVETLLAEHEAAIDVIHVYDAPWHQGWIGRALATKYHKRLVLTTYGEVVPHADPLQLIDGLSYRYRDFCRGIVQAADAIASMTAYCARQLDFLGIDPKRVLPQHHVVGMGDFQLPVDSAALVAKYPQLRNRRLILYAGQLLARKGPQLLLEAAPAVLHEHPDCCFAFVGPDLGLLAALQELAGRLGVQEQCLFTGAVSDEELRQFYGAAAVFVFTTVSKIECLGLTFVQAMVAGCPVVAADISGVPEVIRHGENGVLFTPGSSSELQERLLTLLGNQALADQLAAQASHDVAERFSETTALCQLEQIYQEARAHASAGYPA
ncbi:MAG TPA: glycosyltransferase family 4 protein [Caldilineaceae bacterium]|nr:glycosyltransferase family 4 protein [Caldilineaceae bacterium]